ncbi:hypothetical protein ABIE69_001332 [Rhodobacteraceae bacterium MBR-64]|jgi:hypothetical protein
MMLARYGNALLPVAVAVGLLGGCDLTITQDGVARADARINASALIIAGAKDSTIAFEDKWIQQDYSLYRGRNILAEYIYTTTDPETAVLHVPFDFEAALQTWNLNRAHPPVMTGPRGRIDRVGQSIFYQPYRLPDLGWGCVAMKSEWDTAPKDIGPRPTKALMGYLCNTAGAMTADRAEEIAARFFVTGDGAATLAAIPFDSPQAAPLLAEARQGPGSGQSSGQRSGQRSGAAGVGDLGNPGFPIRMGREMIDVTIISDGYDGGVMGGW